MGDVTTLELLKRNPQVVLAYAVLAPLLLCAALVPLRDDLTTATTTLLLVVLVVAAAAAGPRSAGLAAAVSSALWFDFFLTEPYETFAIKDPRDLEAAVLLAVVGVAVSELAHWGRREQQRASRAVGYLDGIRQTAEVAGLPDQDDRVVTVAAEQISAVLGADGCTFVDTDVMPASAAVLRPDGSLSIAGRDRDPRQDGLPVQQETLIPVRVGSRLTGLFAITAATHVVRPTREQCRVAVVLAAQARNNATWMCPKCGSAAGREPSRSTMDGGPQ